MKKILTLFLLLLSVSLSAQKDKQDVVYLNDGSIIKGQLKREDTRVRITLAGGTELVYPAARIDSIKQESLQRARLYAVKHNYYRHDRGYRNMTELGILYNPNFKNSSNSYYDYQYTDDFGFSLHSVNGYQIWPYLYVGAGLGIERYVAKRETFIPIYLRVVSEFLKKRVTPYIFIDAGYAFMPQDEVTDLQYYRYYNRLGGLYLCVGGGLRIYTNSRASILLSAGYKRTNSGTQFQYNYDQAIDYEIKRMYQRLAVSVGVSF